MILFCAYEQQEELIRYAEQYGFMHHQVFIFYKKYSAQVLKANMRPVGNFETAMLFYRDKLPTEENIFIKAEREEKKMLQLEIWGGSNE